MQQGRYFGKAFTLAELMVVVAIMTALSVVALPTLGKIQRREAVRQSAERVANLLRSAQEQSLSEQYIYGVKIDVTNQEADLISYGESYEGQTTYEIKETVVLGDNKARFQGTDILDADSGEAIVRFTRAGLPSTTGTIEVEDSLGNGSVWTVEVAPAGNIKVSQTE